jgi:hypothetical protein
MTYAFSLDFRLHPSFYVSLSGFGLPVDSAVRVRAGLTSCYLGYVFRCLLPFGFYTFLSDNGWNSARNYKKKTLAMVAGHHKGFESDI